MNARDEAYRQLSDAALPGWRLPTPKFRGEVSPQDVNLAHAITRAVIKNFPLLRHLIAHYAGRPSRQIDDRAQAVLAIGLAQLRYFDRLPDYAVVDEAAEQAKRLKLGKAVGFINAVLRRAIRESEVPLPSKDDAEKYAEVVLSQPPELFRRLSKLLGKRDALRLAERNNGEAPLIVRGQPPVTEGLEITPHEEPGFYVLRGASETMLAEWSRAGIAQAQDPTSARVIDQLLLEGATTILDRCCGVGTKTLQIAAAAPNAKIIAMDPSEWRIHALKRSIRGKNLTNIQPIVAGETTVLDEALRFDRILVDAPCSNSGVLIRRPEAKYRQEEKTLRSVEKLQRRILADTISRLAPGGRLVYSTCSIWEEENEAQVQWMIKGNPGLRVLDQRLTLPSFDVDPTKHHDGGFLAVLTRD